MARNNMAVTTRINKALKQAKLEQRFIRGCGYYYVTGVAVSSSMYVCWLEPTERDYRYAREHVNSVLREEGITFQIP
jgi:hypothetical protein